MIPVSILEFRLFAEGGIDFGANPGSSIRGAIYEALRAMYDTGLPAPGRDQPEENPVAWLLRLEDDSGTGGKDLPRPFAVRPPLDGPQENPAFSISFFGRGAEQIPLVLSAVGAVAQIGIGRQRTPFQILGVDSIHPLSGQQQPLIDRDGKAVGRLIDPPGAESYRQTAALLPQEHVTVRFLTPARIIQQDALCHRPDFRPWFQRLIERTRQIGEHYTAEPPWVPFRDLLNLAGQVRLVQDETHWTERWSGSRRDDSLKPTSGFEGRAVYEGPLAELLPWLLLGQALQVGKNTVKGCGWYRLE